MRRFQMLQVGQCLPGFEEPTARAPWPVWKNSSKAKVRPPEPPAKSLAVRAYYQLEALDERTRLPGHANGVVGRMGLAVARALAFRLMNYDTGELDPSYDTIARKGSISRSSAAEGLRNLKAVGYLSWIRRCSEDRDEDGRFTLRQDTNLYRLHPPSEWNHPLPPEAPPPEAGTWGDHPPMQRGTVEAGTYDHEYELMEMEADKGNGCSQDLARLMRDRMAEAKAENQAFPRSPATGLNQSGVKNITVDAGRNRSG